MDFGRNKLAKVVFTVIVLSIGLSSEHALAEENSVTDSLSNLKVTQLTTDNGLSNSNIFAIVQDRQGYMWFATRYGLNRYDGNTIVVYKHDPGDSGSLSDNFIYNMIEGDQGNLWIGTNSGGLNKYDPTTNRFTHYRHNPDDPTSISSDEVTSVMQDSDGYFWLGTTDSGLNRLDPTTETFTHYPEDGGHDTGRILDITEDNQGRIWLVGERGLFQVDVQTRQLIRPPTTIDHFKAVHISADSDGNLWMLSFEPDALLKYDPQAERFTEYPAAGIGVPGSNLLDDGQNGFWVPTGNGLYHFDRQTERFTRRFRHDQTNPDSLSDNAVSSVYRDRAGLFWLGTESGGVNVINFQHEQFSTYRHDPANPNNSISPGVVTAIHEDDGILWMGFYRRALTRFDRSTGRINHYVTDPENDNSLGRGVNLNSIHKDARGILWLGGWDSGLDRFEEQTGRFRHYRHDPDNPNSLVSNHVLYIHEDQDGFLWVGQKEGLSHFDPDTEQFTNYRPDPDDPNSLGHKDVSVILPDSPGVLWLGTWGGVLSNFDTKTGVFRNYFPDASDPHQLNGGNIHALFKDSTQTLWVGAADGLYRYDRENDNFTRYTDSNGLPNSSIQGIMEDDAGRLWISTKNGISRFDAQAETFKNYDESDGLLGLDFSEGCYERGRNGELFFCNSKGLNAFFPEKVQANPYVPPVVITEFNLFNKPVPIGAGSVLQQAISYTDSLTLSYQDTVFSFEFAALSYANSQKNLYRYRLEGFETNWNDTTSNQRLATYTRLEPGQYTFRVQASSSDGVWNEEGVSLPITIIPPWWGTLWFQSLAWLALLGLLIAGYLYRVRQLRWRTAELETQVAQRTAELQEAKDYAEAANQAKSRFLANMGHELRTPLNAVMGFSELVSMDANLNDDQRDSLHIVNRSGEHLLRLINDILDMSKIEAGESLINTAPFDLDQLIREVTDLMRIQADRKHLDLQVEHATPFPRYLVGDEARLRQILVNLVGNALKFTETGGVTIRLGVKPDAPDWLSIEVEDTGIGINAEQQDKVFDPFVQLGKQGGSTGAGLGLSITRQLVQMMGGTISVDSTPGQGTVFTVSLPIIEALESNVAQSDDVKVVKHLAPGQPVCRVLIVEDEADNQELLSRLLESVGYEVRIAENGEQGIEQFKAWRPHFIWMDRSMPVMDGMAATKAIRQLPGGQDVKIVAVTASAFSDERQAMLDGGMDDYLSKPYRAADVYECMAKQLGVTYVYETEPRSDATPG